VVGEQKASSYTMMWCAGKLDLEWRSNSSAKESAKEKKCAESDTEEEEELEEDPESGSSLSLQNGLIPNPRLPNLEEEVR
jgi:hypothetical protein